MRRVKGPLAVVVGLMLLLHAGGTTVYADEKGNNGTIKIHEAGTPDSSNANEPHVCNFHINGNGFDASSSGTWKIEQDPNGSTVVASGSWTANASGDWRTGDMTLPDGHYRALAKQTSPATSGGDKQKVFKVECAAASTTSGNGESSANAGGNAETSADLGGNAETSANLGGNAESNMNATGNTENGSTANATAATGAAGSETNEVFGSGFGPGVMPEQLSSMGAAPGVSSLPSTSTDSNAPLGVLGLVILALGALMLRRSVGTAI